MKACSRWRSWTRLGSLGYGRLSAWLASRSQFGIILPRRLNVSATLIVEILVGSLTSTLLGSGRIVLTEQLVCYGTVYFVCCRRGIWSLYRRQIWQSYIGLLISWLQRDDRVLRGRWYRQRSSLIGILRLSWRLWCALRLCWPYKLRRHAVTSKIAALSSRC